ncbi:Fanconi anemia group I protein-like [Ctenocephalides felis]|uniref:Fanconi anemia group I protein-like n=1 Tax=Ctenocephalides felis TaxID=7515 RepID=UPI000E6E45EF|nr:Fanconi anemia group I protein-like [Ctenocephalides felis]
MRDNNLAAYGLDQDIDNSSTNTDIVKNMTMLNELILFQESLVIFKISFWTHESSKNTEEDILKLFKTYKTYISCIEKSRTKGAKKVKKKTNATTTDSMLQKPVAKMKLPKSLLTLPILTNLLQILYSKTCDVSSKILKTSTEFHQYVLKAMLQTFETIGTSLEVDDKESKKTSFTLFTRCGRILFENCLSQLNVLADFDLATTVSSVEVFTNILQLIDIHYSKKMSHFLSALGDDHSRDNLQESLVYILSQFKIYLNECLKNEILLDFNNQIVLSLIQCVQTFIKHLSLSAETLAFETSEWILSLLEIKTSNTISKALLSLYITFDAQIRITSDTCLNAAAKVCSIMGTINEEQVQPVSSLCIINEETMDATVQVICDKCREELNRIDYVIQYLNGYYTVTMNMKNLNLNSNFGYDYFQEKEYSTCTHICDIIMILNSLSNSQIPTGICTDTLFKTLQSLYETLFNVTKYFSRRVTESAAVVVRTRFDKAVKLAGKKLCGAVYRLISHVEEMQDNKQKTKVLRQTRMIPNLVYAIEKFKKSVIGLSSKTNSSTTAILTAALNIGTTRDFRLHLQTLQSALSSTVEEEAVSIIEDSTISETEAESVTEDSASDNCRSKTKRIRLK